MVIWEPDITMDLVLLIVKCVCVIHFSFTESLTCLFGTSPVPVTPAEWSALHQLSWWKKCVFSSS